MTRKCFVFIVCSLYIELPDMADWMNFKKRQKGWVSYLLSQGFQETNFISKDEK